MGGRLLISEQISTKYLHIPYHMFIDFMKIFLPIRLIHMNPLKIFHQLCKYVHNVSFCINISMFAQRYRIFTQKFAQNLHSLILFRDYFRMDWNSNGFFVTFKPWDFSKSYISTIFASFKVMHFCKVRRLWLKN